MCYPSVLLLSVVRIERYHRLNIKDWNDLKEISPFVITIDIAQSFEFMLRMVHSRHIDMMTYLLQLNKYSVVAVGSSAILKGKEKLGVTFNFDKQDVIDLWT